VKNDKYFDQDFKINELLAAVRTLQSIRNQLCTTNYNQLLLDFHSKAAVYWVHNDKYNRELQNSLDFIFRYYYSRASKIEHELALQISHFLTWFNFPFLNKSYLKNGLDLLEKNEKQNSLSYYNILLSSFYQNKVNDRIANLSTQELNDFCKLYNLKFNLTKKTNFSEKISHCNLCD
jgi:hypothetical protein